MIAVPLGNAPPIAIAQRPFVSQLEFSIHRITKLRDAGLPIHAHDETQLTFAASGTVQIHTDDGVWLVPPQLAAWIPGVRHRLEILSDAELWMVHWRPSALRAWAGADLLARPFALRVTPLLHSLLSAAVQANAGSQRTRLIVDLMLHELTAMPDAPTFLPMPHSSAGRRAAELALADQQNRLRVQDVATRAATSVRTLSRLFPEETGLTFKAWRQRLRIVRSMERLGRGQTIADVSAQAGFTSTAAFSCAFRQVTGTTPSTFLRPASGKTYREARREVDVHTSTEHLAV